MVDLAVVVMLCGFVLWGFVHGAVFNLLGLAALLLAYLLSGLVGSPAARVLLAKTQWSPGIAYLVGRLATAVIIYIPLTILVSYVDRRFRRTRSERLQALNSGVGAACGLAWGMLAAFCLLCAVDVWVKVLPDAEGRMAESARRSFFRARISSANPADRFLVTDVLKLLRSARQDAQVLKRLSAHPHVRQVMAHPHLQRVLNDDELAQQLREDPLRAVLRNENLGRVLADKDLRAMILSAQMRKAIREAMGEASFDSPP